MLIKLRGFWRAITSLKLRCEQYKVIGQACYLLPVEQLNGENAKPVFYQSCLLSPCFALHSLLFCLLVSAFQVTGTFVQNAICRAEEVKDMQRAMKARRLFKSLDDDETGQISFKEILNHTKDREVLAFFRDLDIEPSEAKFLFDMLDVNQSGSIDFEEFLNGCIRQLVLFFHVCSCFFSGSFQKFVSILLSGVKPSLAISKKNLCVMASEAEKPFRCTSHKVQHWTVQNARLR